MILRNQPKVVIMALSSFIPKNSDPYKGYYQITTAPSRGWDGQIYPQITRVQPRSVFCMPSQAQLPQYLGKCLRVANNRLIYGLSPIQYIETDMDMEEDVA